MSLGLREWTPSFMRKLHLRHFPAAFCKHPCACECCCSHTQHTQHTGHAAVVHLQEYVASYLWPELCEKTSVSGCGVAQIGLQSPGLMPCATGDSPAFLSPEVNFGSGSCTVVHRGQLPVGERKGSKLLARGWHRWALLPWYLLGLQESHENLPAIILSWTRN